MENRNGLAVDACVTQATGTAEREAAVAMATNLPPGATLGADKGYDTADFVAGLRTLGVTPHVAQHDTHRRSAIDGRTTRHPGYAISQRKRKRVEEIFGWAQDGGPVSQNSPSGRPPGRMDVHLRAGGLQPGADSEPDLGSDDDMMAQNPRAGVWTRDRGHRSTRPHSRHTRRAANRSMLNHPISASC